LEPTHPLPHASVSIFGQVPVPLHCAPTVATASEHSGARHSTVGPGYTQASRLVPSQVPPQAVPSLPHFGLGACGAAFTSGEHVPAFPVMLQASH
jgi:hypothetical protein